VAEALRPQDPADARRRQRALLRALADRLRTLKAAGATEADLISAAVRLAEARTRLEDLAALARRRRRPAASAR